MVVLDGDSLTIAKLVKIARNFEEISVSKKQWKIVNSAEKFIQKHISDLIPIYGINTGLGALAQVRINLKDLIKLQQNILSSHHAGIGKPFDAEFVRAAMVLRINTLIKGYSGVSQGLIKKLILLVNKNIVPMVPSKGSVGASGDLSPMAAISLTLTGKGDVLYSGKILETKKVLRAAHIKPLVLKPKEALSLLNGTQFSTALASIVNYDGLKLCSLADLCGAMSLEGLQGTGSIFNQNIFNVRAHFGAKISAKNIRRLIKDSDILKSHKDCPRVQDPYSLRCLAQVHGAVRDLFAFAKKTIEIEINSVTDNPIIFPEKNLILNSGNFHGEPIAFALDIMTIGLAELAAISERRVFRLLDSKISGLNPFLAKNPGLNSGFMMAQVTAAALVSQNKILCHPASVDSIPTSANQEDHVSMSMNAGLKALEVLENTKYVFAIELLCACQAIDLLKPLKTSPQLEKVRMLIRKVVPFIETDQPLTSLIEKIKKLIDDRVVPLLKND